MSSYDRRASVINSTSGALCLGEIADSVEADRCMVRGGNIKHGDAKLKTTGKDRATEKTAAACCGKKRQLILLTL